ncbi:MAG: tetratricopeptide repeat protein, partial [Chloroflexi bacterium]|nr:tetratricopeptide repeat protein [Chloroflexota bacterium]
ATALQEASLRLKRTLGDQLGIAWSLSRLGEVAWCGGDPERAATLYAESLALRREVGDKRGIAECLCNLGHAAAWHGDEQRLAGSIGRAWFSSATSATRVGSPGVWGELPGWPRHLANWSRQPNCSARPRHSSNRSGPVRRPPTAWCGRAPRPPHDGRSPKQRSQQLGYAVARCPRKT